MASHLYDYTSSYGGGGAAATSAHPYAAASSYLYDSSLKTSRYSSDSLDLGAERARSLYRRPADRPRLPSAEIPGIGASAAAAPTAVDHGVKRPAEALHHQTILGNHNSIGQSEALFSSNSLAKHHRLETASSLPTYPQRPGEKDCTYYMRTRTCKFGVACKFDHPVWVPEGGIPDWKEAPLAPTSESLPERPGEPDCPYYMKTQRCKFRFQCKFNHPKNTLDTSAAGVGGEGTESTDISMLPERPSEPICSLYEKSGMCKFGASCKFHHPKDLRGPSKDQNTSSGDQTQSADNENGAVGGDSEPPKAFVPFTAALLHNSKGLPIRPGEPDCPFYLKTGSCKYGATCRYNHPDRNSINPPLAAGGGHLYVPSTATNLQVGILNSAANLFQHINPMLVQTSIGVGPSIYPQRPGEIACDFYMKTGQCKFSERCKFHHPIDRTAPALAIAKQAQQNVKLTLAGLPRREGSVACAYYMKTGTCKFGALCRFDHPPPGEAIALAAAQANDPGNGTADETGEEGKDAAGSAEELQ